MSAVARLMGEERNGDHRGEHVLEDVQHAEDQPPNAKANLQRDAGRTKLQRRLDEGDGQHHADPDEHHGDRQPRARVHGGSLRQGYDGQGMHGESMTNRDYVAELVRWQDAGATWQVVAQTSHGVTIALMRCDGGEEVDRFSSERSTTPGIRPGLAGGVSPTPDTIYADVSEWQVPVDDSYPHRVLCIRSNDGNHRDRNWNVNYPWCKRRCDTGELEFFIVYFVWRRNWRQTVDTLKDMVGNPHPRMAVMIDVESWGRQIAGDQSDGINRAYSAVAEWLGEPRRVVGYGNVGDLNRLWPVKPKGIRLSSRPTEPTPTTREGGSPVHRRQAIRQRDHAAEWRSPVWGLRHELGGWLGPQAVRQGVRNPDRLAHCGSHRAREAGQGDTEAHTVTRCPIAVLAAAMALTAACTSTATAPTSETTTPAPHDHPARPRPRPLPPHRPRGP